MTKSRSESEAPRVVDTLIRYDHRDFQHCDIRDLDMHGVLVLGRDGSLTRLPKNSAVELALKLNIDGKTRTHVLRARVERKSRDGTNLVFTNADLDTYSALLHLNLNDPSVTKRK